MSLYRLEIKKTHLLLFSDDEPIFEFRVWFFKPYLQEISLILHNPDFLDRFKKIEQKAVRRYFLFLLSQKDRLSKELAQKAKLQGFSNESISSILEEFRTKKLIDDTKVLEAKAIHKIRKGHAFSSFESDLKTRKDEAKELEKATLKKLIAKKRTLLNSPDFKIRQKGYRFFLSRGYCIDQIKSQLNPDEDL